GRDASSGRPPSGRGSSGPHPGDPRRTAATPRPTRGDEPRTRVMPVGTPPSRSAPEGHSPAGGGGGPRRPARPTGPGGPGGSGPGPTRRRRPGRTIVAILLVLALAWTAGMVWAVSASWSEVHRVDATPEGERP